MNATSRQAHVLNRPVPRWLVGLVLLGVVFVLWLLTTRYPPILEYRLYLSGPRQAATLPWEQLSQDFSRADFEQRFAGLPTRCDNESMPGLYPAGPVLRCSVDLRSLNGVPTMYANFLFAENRLLRVGTGIPWWSHGSAERRLAADLGRASARQRVPVAGVRLMGWKLRSGDYLFLNVDRGLNPLEFSSIQWVPAASCAPRPCIDEHNLPATPAQSTVGSSLAPLVLLGLFGLIALIVALTAVLVWRRLRRPREAAAGPVVPPHPLQHLLDTRPARVTHTVWLGWADCVQAVVFPLLLGPKGALAAALAIAGLLAVLNQAFSQGSAGARRALIVLHALSLVAMLWPAANDGSSRAPHLEAAVGAGLSLLILWMLLSAPVRHWMTDLDAARRQLGADARRLLLVKARTLGASLLAVGVGAAKSAVVLKVPSIAIVAAAPVAVAGLVIVVVQSVRLARLPKSL